MKILSNWRAVLRHAVQRADRQNAPFPHRHMGGARLRRVHGQDGAGLKNSGV